MPIDITNLINPYLKDYKKQKKPGRCELCKCEGCLIWHSIYFRNVITLSDKYEVPIRRVKCKRCGGTFPILPDFILKYHRYGADVILLAVERQKTETPKKITSDLSVHHSLYVADMTVWLWKKKISTPVLRRLRRLLE